MAGKVKPGEAFRLGGLVEQGSVQREPNQMVRFRVTDGPNTIAVTYQGCCLTSSVKGKAWWQKVALTAPVPSRHPRYSGAPRRELHAA